jgi:hypothetical protein
MKHALNLVLSADNLADAAAEAVERLARELARRDSQAGGSK